MGRWLVLVALASAALLGEQGVRFVPSEGERVKVRRFSGTEQSGQRDTPSGVQVNLALAKGFRPAAPFSLHLPMMDNLLPQVPTAANVIGQSGRRSTSVFTTRPRLPISSRQLVQPKLRDADRCGHIIVGPAKPDIDPGIVMRLPNVSSQMPTLPALPPCQGVQPCGKREIPKTTIEVIP